MERARHLSKRELELIDLAAQGLTDHGIAHQLGLSTGTVATYWGRIRSKYGGSSRTEVVVHVMKERSDALIEGLRSKAADLSSKLQREAGELAEASIYHELFDQDPQAIICVDEHGFIDNINEAAAEMFGYKVHELKGKSIDSLVPEKFRGEHRHHREAYLNHPERREMGTHCGTPGRSKSGAEISIAATLVALRHSDKPLVACFIQPCCGPNWIETQALLQVGSGDRLSN